MATPQENLNAAYPGAVSGDIVQDLTTGEYWEYNGNDWELKSTVDGLYIDLDGTISPFKESLTVATKTVALSTDIKAYPYDLAEQIVSIDEDVNIGAYLLEVNSIYVPATVELTINNTDAGNLVVLTAAVVNLDQFGSVAIDPIVPTVDIEIATIVFILSLIHI